VLTADPANLALPSTAAGSASAPQTVTVRNTGTDTVALDQVATSGDFTATSDCGQTLAAGASCAVAVTFRPSAAGARGGRLSVTGTAAPLRVALTGSATANASANLALGKNATSTGDQDGFPPTNATDGNTSSYWESTNKKFPQSITIDLGETSAFSKVVLKLPPPSDWTTRDETVAVLVSTDGTTFTVAKAAAPYRLDPAKANTATITLAPTKARYVRLTVSDNTAWPAAQFAEVEILK
jgi:hypothetical protein